MHSVTCLLTSTLLRSSHLISTHANSHPSSWGPSKMWHKQMWQKCPLQASYFINNFPVKAPEPILSSVQPPFWSQPGCWTVLKGRQEVRSAGNISALVAATPCSFAQAHDPASCVWVGVSGSSAYVPSAAAAGLHFQQPGDWSSACLAPLTAYFFPICAILKPSAYQPTPCWSSLLNHKSPGTHFTMNSTHYWAQFIPYGYSVYQELVAKLPV